MFLRFIFLALTFARIGETKCSNNNWQQQALSHERYENNAESNE